MPSMAVKKCERTRTKVFVKCEGRANKFVCLCVRPTAILVPGGELPDVSIWTKKSARFGEL